MRHVTVWNGFILIDCAFDLVVNLSTRALTILYREQVAKKEKKKRNGTFWPNTKEKSQVWFRTRLCNAFMLQLVLMYSHPKVLCYRVVNCLWFHTFLCECLHLLHFGQKGLDCFSKVHMV